MATQVQTRRGTTAQHSTFTGAVGEVTVDTDKEVVVVHDGTTAGGYPQMRENGSQNLVTTGSITGGRFIPTSSTVPTNGVYLPSANTVAISTNSVGRVFIDSSGNVGVGSTPSYALDVNRGAGNGISARFRNSGGSAGYVYNSGADTVYFTGDTAANNAIGFNSTNNYVSLFSGNGTERMRLDSSGRLGLGNTVPISSVKFGVTATTNNARIAIQDSTANTWNGIANNNDKLQFERWNGSTWDVFGTFDNSGRLGVGTTAPSSNLHISSSGNAELRITSGAASQAILRFGNGVDETLGSIRFNSPDDSLQFYGLNDAERMRIDSSGRLLVGTSSFSGEGTIVTRGSSATAAGQSIWVLQRGQTNPAPDLDLGVIRFTDAAGSLGAQIAAQCDGGFSWGTNDYPTRLVFSTTADGASSPTERMRIKADGYIRVTNDGNYSGILDNSHQFYQSAAQWATFHVNGNADPYGIYIRYTGASPNNGSNPFLTCYDSGSTERATIRSNGGLANYSANNANLSDRNAKKDISPAAGTWDCIKEWEVVNYRYKDQPDDADLNLGVIAQQVAESCPEVITVFQEATEDQPEKLGVKEQQMYWMAIKALQEAQVRIEQLEAKVAALESA